ncbi:hypothetical protein IMSHALPRED_001193 [Imshaugia aleurites]|uniref:Uncharacterized protein n=1 Tax=Imshaugia aleurites TaxID=172621 RepID=A0A8H3PF80_9LECA|nr:hypothetical protein IMSHALPRED_001193 [Imshaugia aleurites]
MVRAFNSTAHGSWNQSTSFANETSQDVRADSSPSVNETGQDLWNSSNTFLEQEFGLSFATYNDFLDQCLLWNNECTGNRTEALDLFFNNSGTLYNEVYGAHCIWSRESECAPWLPSPAVLPKFLEWLRQPECVQSFDEYHTRNEDQPPWTWSGRIFDGWSTHTLDWSTIATTTSNVGCCGQCTIFGGNVDVYYWPVTGANSDCVSIVGSTYNDYVSELLTTDNRGYPYWKAQTNPWGQNCSQNLGSITLPPEQALDGAPNALSAATNIIQYRDYSPKNITSAANISTAEAIATIGDFRCTSPSVCVGFSDLYAADACGALSTDGELVSYTIVAFAPGELSTIEIPPWVRASVPPKAAIRPFNFADIPCPPQSVMCAMEYKPAPGEPYRPVLSAPSRISSLLPEWSRSSCVIPAALFNGVDPPRALKPAEILAPLITQTLPTASVAVAAAPASVIQTNEPSKTPSPTSIGDEGASTPSDSDTSESESELSEPSSSAAKQVGSEITDSKAADSEGSNKNNLSPSADPQGIESSIPDPGNTPAAASEHNSPEPGTLDSEQANSPPSDSEETDPQVSDSHDDTDEAQTSSPGASNPDDPTGDNSSADRSSPDAVSDSAYSNNKDSEDPLSDEHTSDVSESDGIDTSSSDLQEEDGSSPDRSQSDIPDTLSNSANSNNEDSEDPEDPPSGENVPDASEPSAQKEEVANPDSNNPEFITDESNLANAQGQYSATPSPNDSSEAESEASDGDTSDTKGTDGESNPLDVLFNVDGASSPATDLGSTDNVTPDDPEYPSSEDNPDDGDAEPTNTLSPQEEAQALSLLGSGALINTPSGIALADGQSPSPQKKAQALSLLGSGALVNTPSGIALADGPSLSLQEKAQALSLLDSAQALSLLGSGAFANTPSGIALAPSLSPQEKAQALSLLDSGAFVDTPSGIALADDLPLSPQQSGNALPAAEIDAILDLLSNSTTKNDTASANVAAQISAQSASVLSSAIRAAGISANLTSAGSSATLAASVVPLGSDGTSDGKLQGGNVNTAASHTAKSSARSLLAARRRPESIISKGAGKLLYYFIVYTLPWLLTFR